MNVICSAAEAITTWVEVISMGIGNISVLWSWLSGCWHCFEGFLINPTISGVCGPLLSGLGLNAICNAITGLSAGAVDIINGVLLGGGSK
jgi:hypothetical protein